jgi:hypothetical protein
VPRRPFSQSRDRFGFKLADTDIGHLCVSKYLLAMLASSESRFNRADE